MTTPKTLAEARTKIDQIDAQIQALISDRARVAEQVREIKARTGGDGDHYRPSREAEVLRRSVRRNRELGGPLHDEVMARLMREIMSACLALESPLAVAYLGPEGTYTEQAAYKHFGHAVSARAKATVTDIFADVEAGHAAYGVVPIENSTEGVVTHTLDELGSTPLKVCGEVMLPVHHHLLSAHKKLADVKRIYAHTQSFAQCKKWLSVNLPNAKRVTVPSNGHAARLAADKKEGAAIAGLAAGERYRLKALSSNIEDDPNNTTRFLIIGNKKTEPTGHDLTSLVLGARKDMPGALFSLIEPFAQGGLNMTRIESRPSRRARWDYNFFIDFEGHQDEPAVAKVLAQVEKNAAHYAILGSYPRAVI